MNRRNRHTVRFGLAPLARTGLFALGLLGLTQLQGCFVVGAAAVGGTALVATDRRTAGAQLEDQTIQVKAAARIKDVLHDAGDVSVDSYNGQVLLTGHVPTTADKDAAHQAAAGVVNVRSVADEIQVGTNASFSSKANDTFITSKVRASYIDSKKLYSQAVQITTCDAVVYLQGIVTQDEADTAARIASEVSGVSKVVTLFQVITPEQLRDQYRNTTLNAPTPTPAASAPNSHP